MGDALRLPTREHTKSLLLLLKTSSSETKKQDRQEDEGRHLGPLALGGCSGPFSDGADDGGVGDLEDGAVIAPVAVAAPVAPVVTTHEPVKSAGYPVCNSVPEKTCER